MLQGVSKGEKQLGSVSVRYKKEQRKKRKFLTQQSRGIQQEGLAKEEGGAAEKEAVL